MGGALSLEGNQQGQSRQLTLLRLSADLVVGPQRCDGATRVDDDRWTAILGLEIVVTLKNSWDKVIIVYHANFNPDDVDYEAYFTLLRSNARGGVKNLGDEETGMWSVSSDYKCSSEYPHTMFVDTPGKGSHTYCVSARSRRCNHLLQPMPFEVGPDGQIAAVLIERTDQKI